MAEQMTFICNMTEVLGTGPLPAHQRKSETSRAAAESMRPHVSRLNLQVYEWLRARGAYGATREEISVALDMLIQSVCGRVNELVRKGYVTQSNEKRETSTGRQAFVMVAVERP